MAWANASDERGGTEEEFTLASVGRYEEEEQPERVQIVVAHAEPGLLVQLSVPFLAFIFSYVYGL